MGKKGRGENILVLACCVLFCRSQVRIKKMLGEFEGEDDGYEGEGGACLAQVVASLLETCEDGNGNADEHVGSAKLEGVQRAVLTQNKKEGLITGVRVNGECMGKGRLQGKIDLRPLVRAWLEGLA